MSNARLSDQQWDKILNVLRQQEGIYIGNERDCRRFVEAVLWVLRSGAQWRLLPADQGRWNSGYRRFARWGRNRVWDKLRAFFSADADLESIMLDSTVVRAHACAAGALPCPADPPDQALGRSRGGFSSKIHVVVDALGHPLRFVATAGQVADVTQVPLLLAGQSATYAIMDKAYDANAVLDLLIRQAILPVIPPKAHRTVQREYDSPIYKERHLVECCIGKLKQFRRVFSRFDKTVRRFLNFIQFAAVLIWLR